MLHVGLKFKILLQTDVPRLRFLTAAFKFRHRATTGYVKLHDTSSSKLVARFGVPKTGQVDTLLIFHEDADVPVASASMKDMSLASLVEIIEANQFLQLPRLSNQMTFDMLCPPETSSSKRRLCVALIAQDEDTLARQLLRDFTQEHKVAGGQVQYVYVLMEQQSKFVTSLTSADSSVGDPLGRVVVMWRRLNRRLRLKWLKNSWKDPNKANVSKKELKTVLQNLLSATEVLSLEAEIPELFDEHALGLWMRIINKLRDTWEVLQDTITKDEFLPAVSLLITVALIAFGGYFMNYLLSIDDESSRQETSSGGDYLNDCQDPCN